MNNRIIIIFLILLISSLTLCQGIGEIEKPTLKPLIPITEYEKIVPKTDSSLIDMVYVLDGASTMDVKTVDGNIRITDTVHTIRDIVFDEALLKRNLDGYNGRSVQIFHINDGGIYDYIEIHELVKADGYVYLFDIEFSEIIIDGYVGTWEVTAYNLSVSDSLNFGQTFNASNVTSLTVNVTDDATKSHPYDINYTGCVLEWRADGDFNDTQGVNTLTGYNVTFDEGKYNEAGVFTYSNSSYVDCGNDSSLNITDTITLSADVVIQSAKTHMIIGKTLAGTDGYFLIIYSDGRFKVQFEGLTTPSLTSDVGEILLHTRYNLKATFDGSEIALFKNGIELKRISSSGNINSNNRHLCIGQYCEAITHFTNGTIDNGAIYNRALSAVEIKHNYYDRLQQFKIKTNSNSTWSTEWNSTADNPIQVPYADGELFSLLNFTVPDTVVQNGITIYDYPSTVQFDAAAIVGYTEDITKITESAAAGTYTLNVTHAANNTGEGYINYTTVNSVLLDADFWNAAVLTTDNPNASLSTTLPLISIDTGYVAATTEFYYLIKMPYFYPPTGLTAINETDTVPLNWDDMPNSDNYSVYQDDAFLINVTASNYTVTGLTPATEYNLSVTTWNGSQQTNKALVLVTTNYTLIEVTNLTITPSTIKEGETSTITVDSSEILGTITSVTITIEGSTYLMQNTSLSTWSYTWTAPQNAPHKYFITQIAAIGLYSTNTTIQTAYINVLSSTGTGGAGGLAIDTVDEPIEDEIEIIPQKPSPDELIQTTLTNITESIKDIFKSDQLDFITIKIIHGDHVMVREFASKNAYQCDSTDPQITCGVIDNTITLIVNPIINDSMPFQTFQTHISVSDRDGKIRHVPISITVINLLWYVDFNLNIGVNNPYIVATESQTGETIGLRMWWVTAMAGLIILRFMRKYN